MRDRDPRLRSAGATPAGAVLDVHRCGGGAAGVDHRGLHGRPASRTDARARGRAPQAALGAGVRAGHDPAVLGLARSLRLRVPAADPRPAHLRLRHRESVELVAPRYARARVRPFPDHLQHQPFPLVHARVVLLAVRDDSRRLCREGVHPVESRRSVRAHLQSVVLSARAGVRAPDPDLGLRHHAGHRDRDDAVLSAAHVPRDLPRLPAGPAPVRCGENDAVGGRHALSHQ